MEWDDDKLDEADELKNTESVNANDPEEQLFEKNGLMNGD